MKQISGISHEKNHRPIRDDDFLFFLPAFKECLVRQVRFVSVCLGQQVAGSVHGQHGRAAVHHFCTPVRHHESNRSAAALVDFSQLTNLPAYTGIIKDFSDLLQNSALASLLPALPREPPYLVRLTPYPRKDALSFQKLPGTWDQDRN